MNNLDKRGAINIYHVVESLNIREIILGPKTGLQSSQIGRK
jgi:hypothetical protein